MVVLFLTRGNILALWALGLELLLLGLQFRALRADRIAALQCLSSRTSQALVLWPPTLGTTLEPGSGSVSLSPLMELWLALKSDFSHWEVAAEIFWGSFSTYWPLHLCNTGGLSVAPWVLLLIFRVGWCHPFEKPPPFGAETVTWCFWVLGGIVGKPRTGIWIGVWLMEMNLWINAGRGWGACAEAVQGRGKG